MENDLKLGIVEQSHFSGADATPHLSLQLSEGPSVRELPQGTKPNFILTL